MPFDKFLTRFAVPENATPPTATTSAISGWEWVVTEDVPTKLKNYYAAKGTPVVAAQLGYTLGSNQVWYQVILGVVPTVAYGEYGVLSPVTEYRRDYLGGVRSVVFGFHNEESVTVIFGDTVATAIPRTQVRFEYNSLAELKGNLLVVPDPIPASGNRRGEIAIGGADATVTADNDCVNGLFGPFNVSAAGYVNLGVPTASLTKRYAHTALRVSMHAGALSSAVNTVARFGVRIDGVDYDITDLTMNTALLHVRTSGVNKVATGVGPGVVTVQARWQRTAGAGVVTMSGDWFSMEVAEVAP